MDSQSSALLLQVRSPDERRAAERGSPIYDHLSNPRHMDIKRDRIKLSFTLKGRFAPNMGYEDNVAKKIREDIVAKKIREDIRTYRSACFDNFGIEVRVHPVSTAFELYDSKQRWIGFNQYVFDAFGAESKVMMVTIDHLGSVRIRYLGAWKPVSAYLANLKRKDEWDEMSSESDIMHRRWRQQADWWKENGKAFPLMKLPSEIREMIFDHYWGPVIEPYPRSSARKLTELGKIARQLRSPTARLLQTSKQVANEASKILFMRTPFLIEHYGIWKRLTMNVAQRSLIRKLELALSHEEFLHLFSAEHIRRDRKARTEVVGFGYPALALREMRLTTLRIMIAAPSLTTKSGKFDGACQKVAVEMIMEAAWPIIRGHPLELVGYVKNFQKKIYEARDVQERKRVHAWQKKRIAWGLSEGTFAEYDEEIDEGVGGVRLDGSRPEVEPEEHPEVEYDLRCQCDLPCAEETWTP